ncbi:hypothetical protein [Calditerricola satsumensis]|uniref:Uncharacterized protein n=1 Tax=Calditerricola satsumensis TaxID=373054 RepID=A0A8J3B928_9BACI|nr:hypothetical protein [Calditerricola satsumensis]GGK04327.1 hypothetical protein GCM10007043_17980 [Calditerricola satsumensis]
MRYGVVGNGRALAVVMPDLEVAYLAAIDPSGMRVFDRAQHPEGACLRLVAGGRVPEPVAQAYVGQSGVLRTVACIGEVEIDATDYLPFARPLFLRDMTIVNRSEAEVPFVLTAEAVSVPPNVSVTRDGDLTVLEGRFGVAAFRLEGVVGLLEPQEEALVRLALAWGPNRDAVREELDAVESLSPQEVLWEWEQRMEQQAGPAVPERDRVLRIATGCAAFRADWLNEPPASWLDKLRKG